MFMTDAGRKTGDSKIDSLAMEYENKYGQPLTDAQIERLDQLSGSSEYGNYAIDTSGFVSDAPFGSPQRESELNAYMKNLQDERNAKRANFTLENLGISPDQTGSFTRPMAPQNPMQGGIGGLLEALQGQMKQIPKPPTQNRGPIFGQGPGKGRRPIFEGGPVPLPPRPPQDPVTDDIFGRLKTEMSVSDDALSRGQNFPVGTRPDGTTVYRYDPDGEQYLNRSLEEEKRNPIMVDNMPVPRAPERPIPPQTPDMMRQLQDALRQKQIGRGTRQPMPTPRGGRGDLGGIIGRLQQQMEQRREAPPMQQRRRPRGGLFSQLSRSIPQDRREQRIFARLADKIPQDRRVKPMGGSLLTKGRGRPDMEEIRRQVMQGINVRGIGM
jgi:hypothetical protein